MPITAELRPFESIPTETQNRIDNLSRDCEDSDTARLIREADELAQAFIAIARLGRPRPSRP